ncbi:MAG: ribonuclease E/G [Eubacterium sp.]|nr:ribonuclease E/G [Eubacterium sp.]
MDGKGKLVITRRRGMMCYGFFKDEKPVELYASPLLSASEVDNIYVARVEKVAEGIASAFADIGNGKKCYIPMRKNKKITNLSLRNNENRQVRNGDSILVQIVKDASGSKAAVADGNICLYGRCLILSLTDRRLSVSRKITDSSEKKRLKKIARELHEGGDPLYYDEAGPHYGLVIRTNAAGADAATLRSEYESLTLRMRVILKRSRYASYGTCLYRRVPHYVSLGFNLPDREVNRVITDQADVFDQYRDLCMERDDVKFESKLSLYEDSYPLYDLYRFSHWYDQALGKQVWLKSGAYLVIEQTEAMVVIDVNSGSMTGSRKKKENIHKKVNREAAAEIARQIRLRNLSGIILIDFINMYDHKEQTELLQFLRSECKKDRVPVNVIDYTALGLVEVTRTKRLPTLARQMEMCR